MEVSTIEGLGNPADLMTKIMSIREVLLRLEAMGLEAIVKRSCVAMAQIGVQSDRTGDGSNRSSLGNQIGLALAPIGLQLDSFGNVSNRSSFRRVLQLDRKWLKQILIWKANRIIIGSNRS